MSRYEITLFRRFVAGVTWGTINLIRKTMLLQDLHTVSKITIFFAVSASAPLLAGCATARSEVRHEFTFRLNENNPEVQILDYKYGEPRGLPTQAPAEALRQGRVSQGTGVSGSFPVGEYLYVKWRVKQDGAIFDRKIQLNEQLPKNMTDKDLHFTFRGRELYVYVITMNKRHLPGFADCPAVGYELFECMTIYPSEQKNF